MKVIFYGRAKEETKREIWCPNCESLMEATIAELGPVNYDQRDGDYYVITCPVCSKKIYLNVDAVRNNTLYSPKGRYR